MTEIMNDDEKSAPDAAIWRAKLIKSTIDLIMDMEAELLRLQDCYSRLKKGFDQRCLTNGYKWYL